MGKGVGMCWVSSHTPMGPNTAREGESAIVVQSCVTNLAACDSKTFCERLRTQERA